MEHDVTYWEAILRMLCAMTIGILVGAERGRNHQPAGMRTHMLVALGACVVMIIGHYIFEEFQQFGALPDPSRLGAQVISGVGFLGAGTIIREGYSIRGLTTAASVWAVACLGLAAGAGYYEIALTGAGGVFVTLTLFEGVQRRLNMGYHSTLLIVLECRQRDAVLRHLHTCATECHAVVTKMQFEELNGNITRISATVVFHGLQVQNNQTMWMERVSTHSALCRFETSYYG